MRSWDKYCEDTEKAFRHFRDCIWQPVYITENPFIIMSSEPQQTRITRKLFI